MKEGTAMATRGDTIEHPVTGKMITFLETSGGTNGEYVSFELRVRPHGFVVAPHIHPFAEESFEIRSGMCTFVADGNERKVGPGEEATVPAGAVHAWWNAGDEEGVAIVEFRPGFKTEEFFESFFGLAQDGKVSSKTGLPNLLWLASIFRTYNVVRVYRQAAVVRATRRPGPPRRCSAAVRLPAATSLPLRTPATPSHEGVERGGRNVAGRGAGWNYPRGAQSTTRSRRATSETSRENGNFMLFRARKGLDKFVSALGTQAVNC
jgi:quercetin dioxygenase-like cupin family protein